ncbi:hypothetical protein NDU88_003073 [Pleurodeles waltl]|uniref:Uncharacterized protein n=1 Tax=Pleurodeles waltl TaxID=8319 RepID=A0AAV7SFT6_PLEWA|nr:hypothetical protein NDU88_003073 [Pleurodeles waltl]
MSLVPPGDEEGTEHAVGARGGTVEDGLPVTARTSLVRCCVELVTLKKKKKACGVSKRKKRPGSREIQKAAQDVSQCDNKRGNRKGSVKWINVKENPKNDGRKKNSGEDSCEERNGNICERRNYFVQKSGRSQEKNAKREKMEEGSGADENMRTDTWRNIERENEIHISKGVFVGLKTYSKTNKKISIMEKSIYCGVSVQKAYINQSLKPRQRS